MELRQYWNVIWRRRWLVLAIVAIAAVLSAFLLITTPKSFKTEIKFITRQEPTLDNPGSTGIVGGPGNLVFTFNRYYNWFSSEFLVDDYTQITRSDAFAGSALETMWDPGFPQKVIDTLNQQARTNTPQAQQPPVLGPEMVVNLRVEIGKLTLQDVKSSIDSDRAQRELHLTINSSSGELAKAIADASAIVLTDAKLKVVRGTLVNDEPAFSQIDDARVDSIQSSRSRDIINAVVRVIIGVVLALALAFLLEYLDSSIRDERDARKVLDLPVLGTIPRA
ncbi:MAG: Wzz/FepE/Etk N-terminal domain-containing protein [Chloroflexota bacterium]